MKKVLVRMMSLALALMVIVSVAGCAPAAPSTTAATTPAKTTAGGTLVKAVFISQDMSNASQAFSQKQFMAFDENYGFDVSVVDSKGDVKTEAELIDASIAQGVKVIFINPNDIKASAQALQKAKEAGIIVGLFSSDLAPEFQKYRDFYCGVDDTEAGKLAAKAFIEHFPNGAKIVEIGGQFNHGAQILRHDSFNQAIAGTKIEVIDYKATQLWDSAQAMAIMESMIAKEGDQIQGVYCHWDEGCLGVIEALKAANRMKDIYIVGVDGNRHGFMQVANGEQAVTLAQNFTTMSKKTMELARALLDGKTIEKVNWIPLDVVTKENVAKFPTPEW